MAAWATKVQARAHWKDAVSLDDAVLDTLLNASTNACRSYAPKLTRIITDAAITDGSTTLTTVSSKFDELLDTDAVVLSGAGVGPGNTIDSVVDSTTVVLTVAATATATGVEVTFSRVVNENYMLGCVYQAREIYAASVRGESDVVGVGDFVIRARPLTAAVKQLLRPQRVLGSCG